MSAKIVAVIETVGATECSSVSLIVMVTNMDKINSG